MNCLLLNPFLCIILKYFKIIHVLRHFGKTCTVLFQAMPFQYAPGSLLWYFIKMSNLYKTLQLSLWYLLTIGLLPVFSFRWSLPSALGCTPKQLDSGKTQDRHAGGRYWPHIIHGLGLDQKDLGPPWAAPGWLSCELLTRARADYFVPVSRLYI